MYAQAQEHWQTPPRMLLSSARASEIARLRPLAWDMASRLVTVHDTLASFERAIYASSVTVPSTHDGDHAYLLSLELEM